MRPISKAARLEGPLEKSEADRTLYVIPFTGTIGRAQVWPLSGERAMTRAYNIKTTPQEECF